ncbi:HD domain-containing protein [Labrys wisconsinensis]|uniref:HD/PDEase domain-containing protein n=1 Tax=Labrys wisconsinensis TaxID=425677 RepID=A0ABU0J5P3_9HYPH|nr:HD domain-containing protein [Labrys wisconsinensis]MDQ0469569.1 hypothetical protein [Labrys wisconsinensis]
MIELIDQSEQSIYNYAAPIDFEEVATEYLFVDLVQTAAFRRLRGIRFLGGIDYLLVPAPNGASSNVRYTRYQHSLGVARLALHYANLTGLSNQNRRLAYVAALLHDIGHAPLSHSLEPIFEAEFGLNHHIATEDIIAGRVKIGQGVYQTLRRFGIDPDQIIAILAGEADPFQGFFSGPINFDTIEGILRSRRYVMSNTVGPTPIDVVNAAIQRKTEIDRQIVDSFWKCKDDVYNFVIKSRDGALVDHLCQYVMRGNLEKLSRRDFLSTERYLFRKIPELRLVLAISRLRSASREALSRPVAYKARHFYVDTHADFFAWDDERRYRQNKQDRLLSAPASMSSAIDEEEWDLFHGGSVRARQTTFGRKASGTPMRPRGRRS